MGSLLLVDPTPDEESTLGAVLGPGSYQVAVLADLEAAFDGHGCVQVDERADGTTREPVDAVVVGTATAAPLAAVQRVHRAQPLCEVVLLTTAESDEELRRSAMYAPGIPASLAIVGSGSPDLGVRVTQGLENGRLRRVHEETVSAVVARETPPTPYVPSPASLGALLDHAPFGVLVGDLDGRLVTWNRWAGDLLGLSADTAGELIPRLFSSTGYLDEAFVQAKRGRLSEVATATIEGPDDTVVELSTAPTRLENGDEALLVLLQDMTARRQAERTRDRLASHVGLLGRVSEALAGILDVDMALARLADQVVPDLADWVSLQTYDQRGQSRRAVLRHRDRTLESEASSVRQGLMGLGARSPSRQAVRSGAPVLLPAVSADQLAELVPDGVTRDVVARLGVGSVLALPLPGRDEVRGSMTLVRTADSPSYSADDQAVAVEVGRRAGIALDTLSLYSRQRDLAEELQRSLLTEPPQTEGAEVVVRYVAAAEEAQVGGDWYDAFVQADGSTVLVIGDVMGHDNRAAAAMGQLRALLRGIAYTTGSGPAEMLSRLDVAVEGLGVQTTATGLVVQVEPRPAGDKGPARLCWSNAGHPPAIVVPPGGGAVVLQTREPDLLLGVLPHAERQETRATLEPGATLLLYTDGLVERRGKSIDEGIAALTGAIDRLSRLPLQVMCDRLLAELLPEDHDDDVALVAVRLRSPEESGGGFTDVEVAPAVPQ